MGLFRGLIRRILAVFLLLCILAAVIFLLPLTEQSDMQGLTADASWMSYIPDAMQLNEITIPGTHSSASEFTQLPFFTRCQASSIREQLDSGFRYLDIRLAVDSGTNRMKLMHGSLACTTNAMPNAEALDLDSVLQDCYSFLQEHPTETILFCVRQESGDESVADFEAVLYSILLPNISYWLLTDHIPTLGEARGKLVLLRHYEDAAHLGSASGISFTWAEQSGSAGSGLNTEANPNGTFTLYVQDRYQYGNSDKWSAFVSGMAAGGAQISGGSVSLNFLSTSGSLPVGHPYAHASNLNSALRNRGENLRGWIVLDFGEPYLARMIYRSNAAWQLGGSTANMTIA